MDFNDYLNDLLGDSPVLQEDSSKIDFEKILDYSNALDRQKKQAIYNKTQEIVG